MSILGDNTLPRHPKECKELGITHVLNAAQGSKFGQVDTNENLYTPYGLNFYGIEAQDNEKFNLASHFYKGKLYSNLNQFSSAFEDLLKVTVKFKS